MADAVEVEKKSVGGGGGGAFFAFCSSMRQKVRQEYQLDGAKAVSTKLGELWFVTSDFNSTVPVAVNLSRNWNLDSCGSVHCSDCSSLIFHGCYLPLCDVCWGCRKELTKEERDHWIDIARQQADIKQPDKSVSEKVLVTFLTLLGIYLLALSRTNAFVIFSETSRLRSHGRLHRSRKLGSMVI